MLNLINDYLQLGLESTGDQSAWPLAMATFLVAAMILKRQSRD